MLFIQQKVLILMMSLSIYYSFMRLAFGVICKKSRPYQMSSRISSMLSSRSFIVLCFTLTTVIHFELIFVKGVRSVSRFFFLKCGCLVLQHHLLKKKNLVCPLYYLCSSVKEKFTIFVGDYFCILFCVPLISLFVFSPINATLS